MRSSELFGIGKKNMIRACIILFLGLMLLVGADRLILQQISREQMYLLQAAYRIRLTESFSQKIATLNAAYRLLSVADHDHITQTIASHPRQYDSSTYVSMQITLHEDHVIIHAKTSDPERGFSTIELYIETLKNRHPNRITHIEFVDQSFQALQNDFFNRSTWLRYTHYLIASTMLSIPFAFFRRRRLP